MSVMTKVLETVMEAASVRMVMMPGMKVTLQSDRRRARGQAKKRPQARMLTRLRFH